MVENWYLLQSGPGAADFNMAFDEALLESASRLCKPFLRFYSWTQRAASFGYSQKYSGMALLTFFGQQAPWDLLPVFAFVAGVTAYWAAMGRMLGFMLFPRE